MKRTRIHTSLEIEGTLPVAIFKEGRKYIAYTPLLDLTAQGTSLADVQKNFTEVFSIYLEETIHQQTLEKDLMKHGWRKGADKAWIPPGVSSIPQNHSDDIELKAFVMQPFPKTKVPA